MSSIGIYENALINNIVTTKDGEYLSILEWIEKKISIEKTFTVDMDYMKKILGPEFSNTDGYTIYNSLRRILKNKYNTILSIKRESDGTMYLTLYSFNK